MPEEPLHPDHPHGTPPGRDPDFVPPGHGGTPPGQADTPEAPDMPEAVPHPDHPIVEPTLGFAEFVAVQPMRAAAQAALRRWMTTQGYDAYGHYALATWQGYYQAMLVHH